MIISIYHAVRNLANLFAQNLFRASDLSAAHTDIHYLKLDWLESLEEDGQCMSTLIHEKVNPDVILGADLVCLSSLIP